jgi:hypothetical protein
VVLEFRTEGAFKAFIPGGKFNDSALVQLWIGQGDNPHVTAALKEDRSKEGRVVVGFTADRVQRSFAACRWSFQEAEQAALNTGCESRTSWNRRKTADLPARAFLGPPPVNRAHPERHCGSSHG